MGDLCIKGLVFFPSNLFNTIRLSTHTTIVKTCVINMTTAITMKTVSVVVEVDAPMGADCGGVVAVMDSVVTLVVGSSVGVLGVVDVTLHVRSTIEQALSWGRVSAIRGKISNTLLLVEKFQA